MSTDIKQKRGHCLPRCIIRPKKNICVFQVSRPYLRFWPDPKHFIALKEEKRRRRKKERKKKKKKKMCCGHKTYGSILSLQPVSFSVFVVPITGRLALKFEIFITIFRSEDKPDLL